MTKWADYLISAVSYNPEHLISAAIRHRDSEKGITKGEPIDRLTISSDIKNGLTYLTIYSGKNSWRKGQKIHTFTIEGNPYIRIDGNKVKLDHLGDLPETSIVFTEEEEATPEQLARLENLEKQIQELESQPEQVTEPEPPSSPRGSLPKESTEELSQELELVPEQVTEPEPPSSPRGSLPKESTKPSEKPSTIPEEEEATPEQLAQLNDLQQQIDELENILSSQTLSETLPEEEEATPEQLAQLNDLQQQIDELEDMMSSKLDVSKKSSKKSKKETQLETTDTEHEIIKTLKKQNKKLDKIEKKLSKKSTKTTESDSIEAYCVRCKIKRKIKDPKETTMKNGRAAVKGTCSVCNCNVFRIGKMKK